MKLAEILLRKLSRKPGNSDYETDGIHSGTGKELSLLRAEYYNFSELVSGKRVVDFGCGEGQQSLSLFEEEGCYVCGVDTNDRILSKAIKLREEKGIDEHQILFCKTVPSNLMGTFDIVISQNSMEHFDDPFSVLEEMKQLIIDKGKLLITFGPPWYAPYGSHMQFFCKVPWLNIFFSEKTVMTIRSDYRDDGAMRYVDVESGLNMMTIKKFESIVGASGLNFEYRKYNCVKGQDWMSKIPFLREFFINHVTCILSMQT